MPEFQTYELTRYKIGGESIGFNRSEQTLQIAGEDWAVESWLKMVERVQTALEREGWTEKKTNQEKTDAWNGRGSEFLDRNVGKINMMNILNREKGLIKDAPFFLKPFYDGVITKES